MASNVNVVSSDGFWLGAAVAVGVMWAAHTWGGLWPDPNALPVYGDTGLPKNCRAIIQTNIDYWHAGPNNAEGALASIERNCGLAGYSWPPK